MLARRHILSWALGFAALFQLPAAAQESPAEVGVIVEYNPPAENYVLTRRGATVPVMVGGRIMNGDQIDIKTAFRSGGRVTIGLMDRPEPVLVSSENAPYIVRAEVTTRHGWWSGLFRWASEELDWLLHNEQQFISANTRAARARVPLLRVTQRLAAGRRHIVLAWPGGNGPVHIAIARLRGGSVVYGMSRDGSWTSPLLDLTPGTYVVEVIKRGQSVRGRLDVVAPADIPATPTDIVGEGLPDDLRRTAAAVWLASRDNGTYALESLQAIMPISSRFLPARALMNALTAGYGAQPQSRD